MRFLLLIYILKCQYFLEIHSIDKEKFFFIGNGVVGDVFIVKDIISKRGQLKISCSLECLRNADCAGFGIFLNASVCSLLGGNFDAVTESSPNARFYQRATTYRNNQNNTTAVSSLTTKEVASNSIFVSSLTTVAGTSMQTLSPNTESISDTMTPVERTSLSSTEGHTSSTTLPSSTEEQKFSTALPSSTMVQTSSTALPSSTEEQTSAATLPSSMEEQTSSTTLPSSTEEHISSTTLPSSTEEHTSSTTLPSSTEEHTFSTALPSSTDGHTFSTTLPSSTEEQTSSTALPSSTEEHSFSTALPSSTEEQTIAIDVSGTTISPTCADCECIGDVYNASGVYNLDVNGNPLTVYCETKLGHNWMVMFRRTIGNVTFNRAWTEYEDGFGQVDGDFWLGLKNISSFTMSGWSVLRVEMEDVDDYAGYAQYSTFTVGDTSTEYTLNVAKYGGTSGYDAFSYHDGMKFSTKDHDNDLSSSNCASLYGEPWWSRNCARVKFTRDSFSDLGWSYWYMGNYKQLTKITMMIRKPAIIDTSGCGNCDCVGALSSESGIYTINVKGNPTPVYCEMKYGYNWMVIFRRTVGVVEFENMWTDYVDGFGDVDGDHWLGLRYITHFTSSGWDCLRVEMEDIDGYIGYAQYSYFEVGDASTEYKLRISGYSGNAGYDALGYHNNMRFSTKDHDNDLSSKNCASLYGEPWWNNACGRMIFTRNNFNELGWCNWYNGNYKQLLKITMSIRKSN